MIAHMIGNGPSKKDFVHDPKGDIFGCNLADSEIQFKATFIMDKACIDFIHNHSVDLKIPVIIPPALQKLAAACTPPLQIYAVVDKGTRNGESTGHKAVQYLLEKGYTEIHMWGFDSLYLETVQSDSHTKMPECPAAPMNWRPWRKNWERIFNSQLGRNCKFEIHGKPS